MNSDDQARIDALEEQMRDVTRRLTAVERTPGPFAMTPPSPSPSPPGPGGEAGGARDGPHGEAAVRYFGAGQFGSQRIGIAQQMTLSEVRSVPPDGIAPVFAGLASPARIALLYALMDGPRTSQELREVLDAPSVGQLYHHLRELLAAGLVVQPARSHYQIPPGKVVAVCVAVAAAKQLMSVSHQSPPPLPDDADPPADPA